MRSIVEVKSQHVMGLLAAAILLATVALLVAIVKQNQAPRLVTTEVTVDNDRILVVQPGSTTSITPVRFSDGSITYRIEQVVLPGRRPVVNAVTVTIGSR